MGEFEELSDSQIDEIRSALKRRIASSTAAAVAREARLGERTLAKFVSGESKRPRGNILAALSLWYDGEQYRGRPRTKEQVVREAPSMTFNAPSPADQSWQLAMRTMVAQSRLVAELAEKTREAQEPVIRFLEQMDEMYRRPPAETVSPPTEAPTRPVSRAKLDETGRRQLEADSEKAAGASKRPRRKAV